MSSDLVGKVWRSDLAKELKPLAVCLADRGNDDGEGIYPSVSYLEWLLGWSERTVRSGMAALRAMGVLVAVQNEKGGRGKIPTYRLDVFFFTDGKYRPEKRYNNHGRQVSKAAHNPSAAASRSQRSIESLRNAIRKRHSEGSYT